MQTEIRQDFVKTVLSTNRKFKDQFRPEFCGKSYYLDHQKQFIAIERHTIDLDLKLRLIIYTIALCCLRRKNDWYAGVLQQERTSFEMAAEKKVNVSMYNLFLLLQISWPKSLNPAITVQQFLSFIKIKAIPESALRGVFHFFVDDYDLEILDYEPSPLEILNLQLQNKRVLTFEQNFLCWPEKKYGVRDVLSFLLHDFIHAEHFLSDPQKRKGQIGFYHWVKKILDLKLLDRFLKISQFNHEFSYLISDMNSHVIHLLQTFRAILDQQNIDPCIWQNINAILLLHSTNAQALKLALNKINTPLFSISDANTVVHFFENETTGPHQIYSP